MVPIAWISSENVRSLNLIQKIPPWFEKLIVLSESWKDFYVKEVGLLKERLRFENPVIPPDMFRTGDSENYNFVLWKNWQVKGAFDLIEAWSKIGSTNKERSELIIIGEEDRGG